MLGLEKRLPFIVCIVLDEDPSSLPSSHARQLQRYLMPLTYVGTSTHVHTHTYMHTHDSKYSESFKTRRMKNMVNEALIT